MKVLVGRRRIDPVMTAQANAPPEFGREEISEQELNSEPELLRDEELLAKVNLRAEELVGRRDVVVKALVAKNIEEAVAALSKGHRVKAPRLRDPSPADRRNSDSAAVRRLGRRGMVKRHELSLN